MLKELMIKFFACIFLLLAVLMPANALEITAWEEENDGEVTVTLSKTLQINNVYLDRETITPTVIFPKDESIYENIALLKPEINQKFLACFEGVCELKNKTKKVSYNLSIARKAKDKNLVIAKVIFDGDISATFLVSSYQNKNKTMYRVKAPQDFKFLSSGYRNTFRKWLINQVKDLL